MVLQSGNAPYDYTVADPLRVRDPYTNIGLQGPSGIFLEQGQFVITAELRKFSNLSHELEDYFLYINPAIAPSGPYEPKANGSTLGNLLNPANLFIINHILDTRSSLDSLFLFLSAETEYTDDELRTDWLQQIAPELPLPSGYRRKDVDDIPTPDPFFVSTDIALLGGSGVLFDLDFAEVMYNPYPWFGINIFLDVHFLGTFRIVNAPVWPCFQKTDGSFVGLNGREPGVAQGISAEYDLSHFASQEVRLDGYVLLPETDYIIGHGLQNFVQDGLFTYSSSANRNSIANNRPLNTARVFAATQALSSGVYKLAARNRKSVVPFTTVASGLISQWPPSGQAYPATGSVVAGVPRPHEFTVLPPLNIRSLWYNNAEYEHGYQVFNDALWIIDHAAGARAPSGLAIASPFTGHCMWLRFADLTPSTGSGTFGGAPNTAESWGQHIGLEKLGSTIYRVQRNQANGSTSANHRALIQTYNSNLDYLGQIEGPDATPAPGSPRQYTDMTFLPLSSETANEWMLYGNDAGGRLSISFYDQTFSTHLRTGGAFYIGVLSQAPANSIDQTSTIMGAAEFNGIARSPGEFSDGNNATGFHTRGSGIWDLEIGTPGSGIIFKNCRVIDMSKITKQWSSTLGAKIYDLKEVTSSVHLQPGFYALASWGVSSSTDRLFLLRITPRDDATAPGFCVGFWDIVAAYDLGTLPSDPPSITVNNVPNMIYQTIN